MICPGCDRELVDYQIGNIVVDVCRGGCGGIWFDHFELQKFDEPLEPAPIELLNVERDESIVVDEERKRKCPRCESLFLQRHFFSPAQQVTVDSCPGCGGYWLDAGELAEIRQHFPDEKKRTAAKRAYLESVSDSESPDSGDSTPDRLSRAQSLDVLFQIVGSKYVK